MSQTERRGLDEAHACKHLVPIGILVGESHSQSSIRNAKTMSVMETSCEYAYDGGHVHTKTLSSEDLAG